MIETNIGQLFLADAAITRLGELKLPAKQSYHLAKLMGLVRAEIKHFATEREKIVKELGEEREATPEERAQGGSARVVQVPPHNWSAYTKACEELAAVDVTIEWSPFNLASLNGHEISSSDIVALGPLVTFTE